MSPKEQKITSCRRAMACALSIISSGVTHTGQPGPVQPLQFPPAAGNRILAVDGVWPPHTSIMTHGRVCTLRIWLTTFCATFHRDIHPDISLPLTSRGLHPPPAHPGSESWVHLLQQLVGATGFFLVKNHS